MIVILIDFITEFDKIHKIDELIMNSKKNLTNVIFDFHFKYFLIFTFDDLKNNFWIDCSKTYAYFRTKII